MFKNNCEEFFDPRPVTVDPRLVTLDPRPKGKLLFYIPLGGTRYGVNTVAYQLA